MAKMTREDLIATGFIVIGEWRVEGDQLTYQTQQPAPSVESAAMEVSNALYAFVDKDTVLYVGKTSRSLKKRFKTYCRPGETQRTNLKNNANIREAIAKGARIEILAFTPVDLLRYGEFEINLAAGLEDSLIRLIDPPWNGGGLGKAETESAALEAEAEVRTDDDRPLASPVALFTFPLHATYYERGIVNVGVKASKYLGEDGEPCQVAFQDGSRSVASKIDRTANRSGGVRIVGGNRAIAAWFQSHFQPGDTIECEILDRNTIRFRTKMA
ncbi:GIY-YIG nuclease family protein [Sedimentimonas flavescens]|uniref:GIY-YIG nuclease family protein n=1 Tax=Sedimentimonas flavescens TaxID=2851012 RepID=UPI001C49E7BE|nr:GIY-YIG nuclease family protein [Sedimentimonas flavescens]MBW0158731.1 GIY-YIG nuclease family protein [Sedimentimonas flavescens]